MCSCNQLAVCVSPLHLTCSCSWCMPSTCSQVNANAMVVGAGPLCLSSGLQCRLVLHAAHACTVRVALHFHVLHVTCLRPAVGYLATLVHHMLRPIRVHIANPFVQISGLVAGSVSPMPQGSLWVCLNGGRCIRSLYKGMSFMCFPEDRALSTNY